MNESKNESKPVCIGCGNPESCVSLGTMKNVGGYVSLQDCGSLYECRNCSLLFRDPYLSESELIAQYAALPADLWSADPGMRPDFERAKDFLDRHLTGGSVLDIGCFRGDFLESLPAKFEKLGVEPAESAAAIARSKGITIAGATLNEVLGTGIKVNAIVAIDLIEHLRRPMELLEFARLTLLPGGYLVVATGNADYWLWRRRRLDYWYNWTEHIAFFRRSWFAWAAPQAELRIAEVARFCHYRYAPRDTAKMAARTLTYELATSLEKNGSVGRHLTAVYPLSRARQWPLPPRAWWAKDHFIVVLQKC